MIAIENNVDDKITKAILDKGIDLTHTDLAGKTAIDYAKNRPTLVTMIQAATEKRKGLTY